MLFYTILNFVPAWNNMCLFMQGQNQLLSLWMLLFQQYNLEFLAISLLTKRNLLTVIFFTEPKNKMCLSNHNKYTTMYNPIIYTSNAGHCLPTTRILLQQNWCLVSLWVTVTTSWYGWDNRGENSIKGDKTYCNNFVKKSTCYYWKPCPQNHMWPVCHWCGCKTELYSTGCWCGNPCPMCKRSILLNLTLNLNFVYRFRQFGAVSSEFCWHILHILFHIWIITLMIYFDSYRSKVVWFLNDKPGKIHGNIAFNRDKSDKKY